MCNHGIARPSRARMSYDTIVLIVFCFSLFFCVGSGELLHQIVREMPIETTGFYQLAANLNLGESVANTLGWISRGLMFVTALLIFISTGLAILAIIIFWNIFDDVEDFKTKSGW